MITSKTARVAVLALFLVAAALRFLSAQHASTRKGLNPEQRTQIDSIVQKQAKANQCRMTAMVVDARGNPYYFGYDGRAGQAITDFSGSIDIGSCTKLFVATSILQLVEQGKLNLNDRLVSLLPDRSLYGGLVRFADRDYTDEVRLYQLLNHTSGFPDYFLDDVKKEIAVHSDSTLVFTPRQLLSLADRLHEPELKPGEKHSYSNVNYQLLGLILEKYSGLTYQQYIQKHILDPLDMEDTYFSTLQSKKDRSPGYYDQRPSQMPPTIAGAAGDMVSTLADMTTFIKAWYDGSLFEHSSTQKVLMESYFSDMGMKGIQYGLGIVDLAGLAYGHSGATFGFQTYMAATPGGYQFAFGCDEGTASGWLPAIQISTLLSVE